MTIKSYVFVYGTLRRGNWNHYLLSGSEFIGMAKTIKKGWLYVDSIPFLNFDPNGKQIVGELYSVDQETLSKLDDLEGHPEFYVRRTELVEIDGKNVSSYVYVYTRDLSGEGYMKTFDISKEWEVSKLDENDE